MTTKELLMKWNSPELIKTLADCKQFAQDMIDAGMNWHPDDSMSEYVTNDGKGGTVPCFTPEEAKHLDRVIARFCGTCQDFAADFYEVSAGPLTEYLQSQKPDLYPRSTSPVQKGDRFAWQQIPSELRPFYIFEQVIDGRFFYVVTRDGICVLSGYPDEECSAIVMLENGEVAFQFKSEPRIGTVIKSFH